LPKIRFIADIPTASRVSCGDISTVAQVRLKRIGFVFQSLNLIDALSARENVEYVMLLQGIGSKIRRKRSTAILQSMGLEELMDRNIHQMSGGQRQRIDVARAVVAEPQLILADQPTANLDSENGESLIRLKEQFNRSNGITFMIASQDLMGVSRARRTIWLKDGTIEKDQVAR
jgi:putative ABC transport system ATP-binding protein